tara:strand:- start:273 stop:989 length:717 start_codon:yes stop_codon:yes gene_type:complete
MKNHKVEKIKNQECKEWFLHKHYAKRIPSISYAFGLYKQSSLIGVCSFGRPMSPSLTKGAFNGFYQDSFLELNRLVINEGANKNALSFFVSQSLKQLPRPNVIVSYADTSQNHHGYIYQATNWIYTGLSAKRPDYHIKGLNLHTASITDILGRTDKKKGIKQVTLLKEKYGDDFYTKDRPRKHRYFYLIGTKKDRKEMIKNLAYKIEPYPKGNNKRYDSKYRPSVQSVLALDLVTVST